VYQLCSCYHVASRATTESPDREVIAPVGGEAQATIGDGGSLASHQARAGDGISPNCGVTSTRLSMMPSGDDSDRLPYHARTRILTWEIDRSFTAAGGDLHD
jgi:hypothetical protein